MTRPLQTFVRNIQTCHACPFRRRRCQGVCPCQVDGVDIVNHARRHDCPLERFAPRGFGDTLARLFHRMGITRLTHAWRRPDGPSIAANARSTDACGCRKRREKLNQKLPYDFSS